MKKRKPSRKSKDWIREFQKSEQNKMWRWGGAVLIAFLFVIGGCGGSSSPPPVPAGKAKPPSAEQKKEEPTKVAEKKEPEKKEEKEFTYNPEGKPDPFKPFIQLTPVREALRKTPLTPLQKYDISQIKLVAIISAPEGNIAMVEDATGKGYFLKKGTWVGKNDGKVTKILKDKVVIEEAYQDIFGQTKTQEILLILHKVEEGGEL
ncbi:MAG: pilus assembly protein PilP [Syntrophaceae bacterium]|nr:pilus assembly protein PilP [Syntrophaceae bacterium]